MSMPRRHQTQKWVPAEQAISTAKQVVEMAGADVRLTDALILLNQAQDRIADWVEDIKPESDIIPARVKLVEAQLRITYLVGLIGKLRDAVMMSGGGWELSSPLRALVDEAKKVLTL